MRGMWGQLLLGSLKEHDQEDNDLTMVMRVDDDEEKEYYAMDMFGLAPYAGSHQPVVTVAYRDFFNKFEDDFDDFDIN